MRLIIVSNRLPVTIENIDNKFVFKQSIGGLATGLNSYIKHLKKTVKDLEIIWIGWPGLPDSDAQDLKKELLKYFCYPVFIPEDLRESFYEGFSNQTLWPLFHYLPNFVTYVEEQWHAYQEVNQLFCNAINDIAREDDIIWIHDYHFLLLPQLVRQQFPAIAMGFFLHIPFPSFEILEVLPKKCRQDLLGSLLGADLIGFHTQEYSQHFMKSVFRLFGYDQHLGFVKTKDRLVKVDVFPMGIDFDDIQNRVYKKEVIAEKNKLQSNINAEKVILSVDRLDYTKGILDRLKAYQIFLENNPQWREKVILVLIVAPSRDNVDDYNAMRKHIDEIVGHVNGMFGSIKWTPILYQYKTFTLDQLMAFYSLSDIALVTSLRDGMNLIAKEYLATKVDKKGVLILSETAGSAKELLDAIIVNPNSHIEIANALLTAVEMPEAEQIARNQNMQAILQKNNLINWGKKFIQALTNIKDKQIKNMTSLVDLGKIAEIDMVYRQSHKRLIFLDYDGTLVAFNRHPDMACPTGELFELLSIISKDPKNKVIIISGRDRTTLENWLGHLNLDLVAEHSVWMRQNNHWEKSPLLSDDWKKDIYPMLNLLSERLAGSFIEEKEHSLVWHYRNADHEKGEQIATELADYLMTIFVPEDVQIQLGNKILEIKNPHIGKKFAVEKILETNQADFILAIGDDTCDEEMFAALPAYAISIKVGMENTSARLNFRCQSDVMKFLRSLKSSDQNSTADAK